MQVCRSTITTRSGAVIVALISGLTLPISAAHANRHRHHKQHHETLHQSREYVSRSVPTVPSRGASDSGEVAPPVVVGRLGVVTADDVPINAGREQYGRLLSRVSKGQNLTITGQEGDYYAVMMVDGSLGFISKDQVQLLDYEITADRSSITQACGPKGQALIQLAMQYFNQVPYRYGGTSLVADGSGIDCSAFVQQIYAKEGMDLPRTAAEQAAVGYGVALRDMTQWQVGDRLYFQCHHDYTDHAGMYIGNGYFIHSHIGAKVSVSKIDDPAAPYYWDHLVAVRRSPEMLGDAQPASATAAPDTEQSESQ